MIISGGVSSIDDIKKASLKNVEGIIVGKAVYDGDIKLEELKKMLKTNNSLLRRKKWSCC